MGETDYTGQTLADKHHLTTLLGEGGMGAVYRGEHVVIGKKVAVKFLHADLAQNPEVVKRFIREAAGRIHLEVTTLIIPTKNDDPAQIEGIAAFIAGLDPGIPLHLSAYHPQHEYSLPPTPAGTVRRLAEVARRHLRYVYAGNLGAESSDTVCSACGNVLVRRIGWHVEVTGVKDRKCAKCGADSPLVGV